MSRFLSIIFTILLTGIASTAAAQSVRLLFNPPAGTGFSTEYDIQSVIDQSVMGIEQRVEAKTYMVLHSVVKENTPDYCLIEMEYDRLAVETSVAGFSIVIDSDGDEESNPLNSSLKEIVNKIFTARFSKTGQLIALEGMDQLLGSVLESMPGDLAMNAEYRRLLEQSFGKESLDQNFQQFNVPFPEYPVMPGESWVYNYNFRTSEFQLGSKTTASLSAIQESVYRIQIMSEIKTPGNQEMNIPGMKAKMELAGSQAGEILIDQATGVTRSGRLSQEIKGEMKLVPDSDSSTEIIIPMKIKTSIHMKTSFH